MNSSNVFMNKCEEHLSDALWAEISQDPYNLLGNLFIPVQYSQLSDLPDFHQHDMYDYLVNCYVPKK